MNKVIASHNGLEAARRAWELISQGTAPLNACVEGVTLVEDDPRELTVGYGGLPNEEGVVELDAAVMDGATHRGGSVAGLRDIRHAAQVARLIMERTTRVMLVGEGARDFAVANGFEPENLLTDRARQMWLYWKRSRSAHDDWRAPAANEELDVERWFARHFYGSESPEGAPLHHAGTVHCAALHDENLACATSTSGHPFKIPGRVGDSPILGAGLYVDNRFGSCGSIGYGEANLKNLSAHAAVMRMGRGMSPLEAGLDVLREVARTAADWERDAEGRPSFNLQLFLLHKSGAHAGVSLWPGKRLAVCDSQGPRLEPCQPLYETS